MYRIGWEDSVCFCIWLEEDAAVFNGSDALFSVVLPAFVWFVLSIPRYTSDTPTRDDKKQVARRHTTCGRKLCLKSISCSLSNLSFGIHSLFYR